MIDLATLQLAFRTRLLALNAVTTGTATLAATATGYSRTSGSFLVDGFAPGMEITPSGFAANPVDIVAAVSVTAITTATARSAESSASGRALDVRLPASRNWEGVVFTPSQMRPYIEEEFVPATTQLITTPSHDGRIEETGMYVVKIYSRTPGVQGDDVLALRRYADGIRRLFAVGTVVGAAQVTGSPGPTAGQVIPLDNGRGVIVVTVPWLARSHNALLA